MTSVSTIKLLFLTGGIILCLLLTIGFKKDSDTKRQKTADELLKKIQEQRDQVLDKARKE